MLRLALTLAIAAILPSAALTAHEPDQEKYYQDKLLHQWLEQLGAPLPHLRREAVLVLGRIGAAANEAVPALREMTSKDEDSLVRLAAAEALDKIVVTPDQATGRILAAALADPDPLVAAEAIGCIVRLDKNAWIAAGGFAKLKELQTDKSTKPEVQKEAEKAAEAIEKSIKAGDIIKGLSSSDPKVLVPAKHKLEIVKTHSAMKKALLNAIADFKLGEPVRETLRAEYERTYPLER